jgi:hypothetical protein
MLVLPTLYAHMALLSLMLSYTACTACTACTAYTAMASQSTGTKCPTREERPGFQQGVQRRRLVILGGEGRVGVTIEMGVHSNSQQSLLAFR